MIKSLSCRPTPPSLCNPHHFHLLRALSPHPHPADCWTVASIPLSPLRLTPITRKLFALCYVNVRKTGIRERWCVPCALERRAESKRVPDVCGLSPSFTLHSDNSSFMLPRASFIPFLCHVARAVAATKYYHVQSVYQTQRNNNSVYSLWRVREHFHVNYRPLISTLYEHFHRNQTDYMDLFILEVNQNAFVY